MTNFLLAAVAVLILLLLGPLIGVLAGALMGAVCGHFFPETLAIVAVWTHQPTVWQAGAVLGFVGGFFKSTVTQKT